MSTKQTMSVRRLSTAKLDRMKVRRAVREAVKRINQDQDRAIAAVADERSALHKRWRDLVDQAHEAQNAYERCRPKWNNHADIRLLEKLKREHPDLRIAEREMTPHICPIVCAATGLGTCDSDEVIGDNEYGAVMLKAAVALVIAPIDDEVTA